MTPDYQVLRVVPPVPRGFFSRLLWPLIRYDCPESGDIALTISPPPDATVEIIAAWVEIPAEG